VLAGILVLTGCALVLDVIVTKAEAKLLVWRPRAAETEVL
jgi:ABC-type nitrate/sulfonate/bicarbonate transport system permease component